MKRELAAFVLAVLFSSCGTYAVATYSPNLDLVATNYDPHPVEPGKYFTLWIDILNNATETARDVNITLNAKYPFSLDSNEQATKTLPVLSGLQEALFSYKIRVDENAVYGDNLIEFMACESVADACVRKQFNIYVDKSPRTAEIEYILDTVDPVAYPTGTSTLKIDLANIAPGTAYYTIVEVLSEEATLTPEKTFIGTLEADDFDSIELKAEFKDVQPGRYPIQFKTRYKDENYRTITTNSTVYVTLVSKDEAMKKISKPFPLWEALLAAVLVLLVLKFFLWGWLKHLFRLAMRAIGR